MTLPQTESPLAASPRLPAWQNSLLSNLSHKRTILAVCQYYQRNTPVDEIEFAALMDELLEAYREEIADLSRLLRLYDVAPSAAEILRNQVRDARARRTTYTRLEMLLALARANAHWYERELGREAPADLMTLWANFLAAENQRIQRMTAIVHPESTGT